MSKYKTFSDIRAADCAIGLSIGSGIDTDSVNSQIAEQMFVLTDGRPMIAERSLVDALA